MLAILLQHQQPPLLRYCSPKLLSCAALVDPIAIAAPALVVAPYASYCPCHDYGPCVGCCLLRWLLPLRGLLSHAVVTASEGLLSLVAVVALVPVVTPCSSCCPYRAAGLLQQLPCRIHRLL
ncbi:hypothetical protein Acr_21g0004560 [Actinidia rufa]|uniref:Uncharacterized protein n=1 Tax=Actinidia rufa TaxID=165716 RepID=A0A7J0GGA9_9ERIC|nr:hypothetical protein Acr_21g0004560 [Actinidia rufa]